MIDQPSSAFAEACGLSGPLELLVSRPGGAGVIRHAFEQPFVVIGRDPRADLCLEGEQVSRRHAYLQVVAGHVFCLDLGSRTGTHWDDRPRLSGWLMPGQGIRVGPYEVRLGAPSREDGDRPAPPDWSATETRLPDTLVGRTAMVEFVRGGRVETRCRLTRLLTLAGRAPACRLRLSSRQISNYHCALLRTPEAVWVIDLLGRGGVRVNGARVVCCPLAGGDQLRLGEFEMRLRPLAPGGGSEAGSSVDDGGTDSPHLPVLRSDLPLAALRPPARQEGERALEAAGLGPVVRELRLMQQEMFDHFQQALMAMIQVFGTVHQQQMGLIREELERVHALSRELQTLRAEQAKQEAPPPAAPSAAAPAPAVAAGAGDNPPPAPATKPPADGAAAPAAARQGSETIHVWLSQRIEALEQERQSRWQRVMSFMLGK